jgi:hypothetical protein
MDSLIKQCPQCIQNKSLQEYHKKGKTKAGVSRYESLCKSCSNANKSIRRQQRSNIQSAPNHIQSKTNSFVLNIELKQSKRYFKALDELLDIIASEFIKEYHE